VPPRATPAALHRKRLCQTAEGPCLTWAVVIPVRRHGEIASSILMMKLVISIVEICNVMAVNNLIASCKVAAAEYIHSTRC